MIEKQIWIGLVDVVPMPGNNELTGAKGAYVNFIAYASNADEFLSIANAEFTSLEFYVKNIEDAEPLSRRLEIHSLSHELFSLAEDVKRSGSVGFGTFHAYDEDEAIN
jgi:hypothetical protein